MERVLTQAGRLGWAEEPWGPFRDLLVLLDLELEGILEAI